MIRRILKHVVDRARRWLAEPAERPAGAPAPPVAAEPARSWRSSGEGHMTVLTSVICPDCEQPKKVGAYFCGACIAKKKLAPGGRTT